jgi:hypothetical protein
MDRLIFIAKRAAVALLIFAAVIYVGDYVSVRVRLMHPKPGDPLEDVLLQRYYSVSEKGQKLEYIPADPQTVTCVHSMFPHMGYNPCWYVNRLNNQPIPMTILTIPNLNSK